MSASDKKKLRKEQAAASMTEKQLAEKKESKKLQSQTMIFTVVMILVVAIGLGSVGINWYNGSGIPARSTVALTVGDQNLSNVDLNYYFIDTVNTFYDEMYSQYSTYTTLFVQMNYGLDMTKPLNAQVYNEATGETWGDYFLNQAIEYAKSTYILYDKAMEEGYQLSEEDEAALQTSMASKRAEAGLRGYKSMDDYVKAFYGNGADEASYTNYYRVSAVANAFYADKANALTFTDEEIETYNTENYNTFSTFDYSYYYVSVMDYLAEGVKAEDATEEQREAARAAAEAAANELATAKDPEDLNNKLAAMYPAEETETEEEGDEKTEPVTEKASNVDDNAYSRISTLYSKWLGEAERVANDTTVVPYESESDKDELVDGYYVVMYEGRNDFNEKMRSVRHILIEFEGGKQEKDENGKTITVYSDAEKQKARDDAQKLYDEWVAGGATEEKFIDLVKDNTDDPGSKNNEGLYENVYEGMMVPAFNDWMFDENRQAGDHGIVETELGYHLMFFVCEQDNSYRQYNIEATLRSTEIGKWYADVLKEVTTTKGNTDYIYTGVVFVTNNNANLY